jgi:hypothetical protein
MKNLQSTENVTIVSLKDVCKDCEGLGIKPKHILQVYNSIKKLSKVKKQHQEPSVPFIKHTEEVMISLKKKTLNPSNITKTWDGYFRYINHEEKLLTTGYLIEKNLKKNSNMIRFDTGTIERMKARYKIVMSTFDNIKT